MDEGASVTTILPTPHLPLQSQVIGMILYLFCILTSQSHNGTMKLCGNAILVDQKVTAAYDIKSRSINGELSGFLPGEEMFAMHLFFGYGSILLVAILYGKQREFRF